MRYKFAFITLINSFLLLSLVVCPPFECRAQTATDTLEICDRLEEIVNFYKTDIEFAYKLCDDVYEESKTMGYLNGQIKALRFKDVISGNLGLSDDRIVNNKQLFSLSNDWDDCRKIANAYYEICQYDSMRHYINIVIEKGKDNATASTLGSCYNLLGLIEADFGKSYLAIKQYKKAMSFYQVDSNVIEIAKCQYNMANAYSFYNDSVHFLLSERSMLKAIETFESSSGAGYRIKSKIGLAGLYTQMNRPKEAISFIRNRVLKDTSYEDSNPIYQSHILLNLAGAHLQLNQLDSVWEWIMTSERLASNYGDSIHLGDIETTKALFNYKLGNFKYAKENLLKSIKYNPNDWDPEFYELMIKVSDTIGDLSLSNKYLRQFILVKDSILNISNNNKMTEVMEKYESERKELDIINLKASIKNKNLENDLQKSSIESQSQKNNIQFLTILLLCLILVFAMLFLIFIRKRNTEKIDQLKKEQSLETIIHQLKGQDEERSRISKELHDGIANEVLSLKMRNNNTPLSKDLTHLHNEIRDLSHRLSETQIINQTIDDIIKELIKNILLPNNIGVHYLWFPVNSTVNFDSNKSKTIYRILQEVFSNILKHAHCSAVEINVNKYEDNLNIIINDNGVGFNPNIKSKGIGFSNITHRVSSINSSFECDSSIDRGTTCIIDIPIQ